MKWIEICQGCFPPEFPDNQHILLEYLPGGRADHRPGNGVIEDGIENISNMFNDVRLLSRD